MFMSESVKEMDMTPACPRRRQLVSVIIPVHNAAATLGHQLKALKGQEFDGNWEIVAVDNQSTDDSATVIRQYQQQMPQLRFVQATDKQTAAYARNVGARAAKGGFRWSRRTARADAPASARRPGRTSAR